jgi:hypothetical protein
MRTTVSLPYVPSQPRPFVITFTVTRKLFKEKGLAKCQPFDFYIFLGFIMPIFIALFMCIEHPAMSFCDIDDFAVVISCIAMVLFSPSGIFIIISSAFAILASEQPIIFDFADAGTAAIVATAMMAAQAILESMFVPRNENSAILPSGRTF